MEANPVLLEPIASLKVTVPDKFTGDVMGDLNRRRGRVLGMNSNHNGKQIIEADVPMSELFGYNTDLRSMTGGMGTYEYEFSRYEQAPGDVQKKESGSENGRRRSRGVSLKILVKTDKDDCRDQLYGWSLFLSEILP